jgi:hypothetical protein
MHTKFLSENLEGKRPLERVRHRWEDNISTDFREIGFGGCRIDLSDK